MTSQEKAQCVSWFTESKSDVQTRRKCRGMKNINPSRPSIRAWGGKSMETGTLLAEGVGGQEHLRKTSIVQASPRVANLTDLPLDLADFNPV